jgi:hypothetical protein
VMTRKTIRTPKARIAAATKVSWRAGCHELRPL